MEKVNFRTVSGEIYKREYERTTKIHDIKSMISGDLNKDPESILLIYKASVLEDDLTLGDVSIMENSYIIIHFIPKHNYCKYTESDINEKALASKSKGPAINGFHPSPVFLALNQAHVKQLTEMGYSFRKACDALRRTKNDVARAANLLIMEDNSPAQEPVRSSGPYGSLQSDFDNLTSAEKAEVEALRPGSDRPTVLQAYLACEKDAHLASAILDEV